MFSSEKDILTWINSTEEPPQKIFDMFIEEFVLDIKKHSRALISSDMINNITPDVMSITPLLEYSMTNPNYKIKFSPIREFRSIKFLFSVNNRL